MTNAESSQLEPTLRAIVRRGVFCRSDLIRLLTDTAGGRIATVNLQHLALAKRHESFRSALQNSDYFTADGWPVQVLMGGRSQRVERITGRWFCSALLTGEIPAKRLFIIGGEETPIRAFRRRLSENFISSGWLGGDVTATKIELLAETVDNHDPDLVLICLDTQRGEILADALFRRLRTSVWLVQVGGGVDMAVGYQPQVPRIVVRSRMEWGWRLIHSPRRLAHRYLLVCLPYFFKTLLPWLFDERLHKSPK